MLKQNVKQNKLSNNYNRKTRRKKIVDVKGDYEQKIDIENITQCAGQILLLIRCDKCTAKLYLADTMDPLARIRRLYVEKGKCDGLAFFESDSLRLIQRR